MLRTTIASALGFATSFLVASILGALVKYLTIGASPMTYLSSELISDCSGCAIGGVMATVVARKRSAGFYAGILTSALVVIVGIHTRVPFPAWFMIACAILVVPAAVAGSTIVRLDRR